MASFRAQTFQTDRFKSIQDTNTVTVGAGIDTTTGNLTITAAGGTINAASHLALAANKNLSMDSGTGSADLSGGSGVFKTTTGAVTVGPGAVTVSGASSFTAAGTALAVTNNATVGGTLGVTGQINAQGGVGRSSSGNLSLGTDANTNTVLIGRSGQLTQIQGNLQVDGTETVVGTTTFQANATFEGNVTFGNAATDTVAFVSRVGPSGNLDIHFVKELNHVIDVDASTTVSTAGGSLTINSGSGSAASGGTAAAAGGALTVQASAGGAASTTAGGTAAVGGAASWFAGTGGAGAASTNGGAVGGAGTIGGGLGGAGGAATAAGAGGALTVRGGNAGADGGGGGANGGALNLTGGVLTGAGTAGAVNLGAANTSAVNIGASGITTTITGGLTQLTGAVSITGNAASSVTTSSGALTITSAAAATWKTSAGLLTFEGAAGIQVNGAAATSYLTIGVTANQLVIQAGRTLSTTSTGNINLPNNGSARFQIEGSAVGATVTAANFDTLTNGSNADALHTHSAGTATQITFQQPTGDTLAVGNVVAVQEAAGVTRVKLADANGSGTLRDAVGISTTAVSPISNATIAVAGEVSIPDAIWDSLPATSDVGKRVFVSETAGKLTLTAPTSTGAFVLKVGIVTVGGTGAVKITIQIGEGFEVP